jgi:hypothetical protein
LPVEGRSENVALDAVGVMFGPAIGMVIGEVAGVTAGVAGTVVRVPDEAVCPLEPEQEAAARRNAHMHA